MQWFVLRTQPHLASSSLYGPFDTQVEATIWAWEWVSSSGWGKPPALEPGVVPNGMFLFPTKEPKFSLEELQRDRSEELQFYRHEWEVANGRQDQ